MLTIAVQNLEGLDRLKARFARIASPDAAPLMFTWMRIIEADNRVGVLAGLDKDGQPMERVTYRPKTPSPLSKGQRLNQRPNAKKGAFAGIGPYASGANNNLSSAEYRRLDGPPLAPRRQFSRVITNLQTGYGGDGRTWYAIGRWDQVLTARGKPFLQYHFNGEGHNLKRDLRGVRPVGVAKARTAARNWMIDIVRSTEG